MRSEEKEVSTQKIKEYADRIQAMPTSYATDGQGDAAIIYLHYFTGSADWDILEKDSEIVPLQAFGVADVSETVESLARSILASSAGAELDIYWTPRPMAEIIVKGRLITVPHSAA